MAKIDIHFKQTSKMNKRLFRSKERARKLWAKETIETKIQELIKMQEITRTLYPEYSKILPWKISIG
jgi:hypothetical protein